MVLFSDETCLPEFKLRQTLEHRCKFLQSTTMCSVEFGKLFDFVDRLYFETTGCMVVHQIARAIIFFKTGACVCLRRLIPGIHSQLRGLPRLFSVAGPCQLLHTQDSRSHPQRFARNATRLPQISDIVILRGSHNCSRLDCMQIQSGWFGEKTYQIRSS